MRYHALGTSELQVSEICLGTMTWGHQNSENQAHEQLDYAIAHGVNFIDTAEMYAIPPKPETQGLTEKYLGSWLHKRGKRDDLVLATKMAGKNIPWIREGRGLTPADVTTAIDNSLKRLQTDYIDLYQLHWPQRLVNNFGERDFKSEHAQGDDYIFELLETLKKQIDSGKIREAGLSNETPWGMMKYMEHHRQDANLPRMQSVQNPYSLIQREFDSHSAEVCFRENIAMLPYSPIGGGVLSGKYLDQTAIASARFNDWGASRQSGLSNSARSDAVKRYVQLAKQHGISPTKMALAFVINRFYVTSTIIGATTMAQLAENIDSVNLSLSDAVLNEIEQIHSEHPSPALI
ncbi:aldo/keto reductase [Ostreibacterium oceani]|uniref:Aldo/keto reductase n=1 Tax=Ostreibacterium oceani TaxID=2654998 RepID=A0A6N7EST5_9GAMM|nr:aldo/keto reductase [Ostreibacterium oceani]MPV85562.1 aldo/keto reductase [Ostreibacterium oceani]